MRKAADLQEDVMMKGLQPNAIPRAYQPQVPQFNEEGAAAQLPGYGQQVLEA